MKPLGPVQGSAYSGPDGFASRVNQGPAVSGLIGVGQPLPVAFLFLNGPVCQVGCYGYLICAEPRVGQRHVNLLSLSGDISLPERGECADGGVKGRNSVDEGKVVLDRRAVWGAVQRHHAAEGLAYGVEADSVPMRPGLAVGRYVDHYDLAVQLVQRLIAETHAIYGPGTEVLEEQVRDLHKVTQDVLASLVPQIDGQALLAGVVLDPVGALAVDDGAVAPAFVALEPFDFDDLSAHAGEHEGAPGTGLVAAKVQQPDALERRGPWHLTMTFLCDPRIP